MGRRSRSVDVDSAWRLGVGRQDPALDSGRVWARHRLDLIVNRAPPDGAVVPAHPHPHEERGSTGEHPPPAANTVRAAQDTLLLTN